MTLDLLTSRVEKIEDRQQTVVQRLSVVETQQNSMCENLEKMEERILNLINTHTEEEMHYVRKLLSKLEAIETQTAKWKSMAAGIVFTLTTLYTVVQFILTFDLSKLFHK